MTTSANLAAQAQDNFEINYGDIRATLTEALIDGNIRYEALTKLDAHAETFYETVRAAIGKDPTTIDETIVRARGKFAKSFMKLFREYGLEEELDLLIPEEEPDYSIHTSSWNCFVPA